MFLCVKATHNKKSPTPSSLGSSLKIIVCECGAEILLIPDIVEMGRAIEAHAIEHQKKEQTPSEEKSTFKRIEDLLLRQVLEKAAQEGSGKE